MLPCGIDTYDVLPDDNLDFMTIFLSLQFIADPKTPRDELKRRSKY